MRERLSPRPGPARPIDPGVPLKMQAGERAARIIGPHIEIRLNGSPLSRVIAYDVARGEVTVYLSDPSGRLLRDADRGRYASTVLMGRVEARWKAERMTGPSLPTVIIDDGASGAPP